MCAGWQTYMFLKEISLLLMIMRSTKARSRSIGVFTIFVLHMMIWSCDCSCMALMVVTAWMFPREAFLVLLVKKVLTRRDKQTLDERV